MKKIGMVFVGILLVILDQITKIIAENKLDNEHDFHLIKDVFVFKYIQNTGAAWGIMQGKTMFFSMITILIIIFIIYFYVILPDSKRFIPLNIVCMVILAGAVGNLIDRMLRGYVVDFIYFKLIDFPIFNVADCYVTVSGVALAFMILFKYKDEDFEFVTFLKKR